MSVPIGKPALTEADLPSEAIVPAMALRARYAGGRVNCLDSYYKNKIGVSNNQALANLADQGVREDCLEILEILTFPH